MAFVSFYAHNQVGRKQELLPFETPGNRLDVAFVSYCSHDQVGKNRNFLLLETPAGSWLMMAFVTHFFMIKSNICATYHCACDS